jgi:hypothetical protein
MLSFYKKYLAITILICLCMAPGSVSAYSTQITLDGKDDAGIYPGQGLPGQDIFVRFVADNHSGNVLKDIPSAAPQFTSAGDVYNYAYANGINDWILESAGNIWSSDKIVGESLSGLSAGTYRISPKNGAYMYDSFDWGGGYQYKYWWKVFIIATNTPTYSYGQDALGFILGPKGIQALDFTTLRHDTAAYDGYTSYPSPSDYYDSPELALAAVQNQDLHIDIPITEGGSLNFWIWDWNSIDNSGSVSLNVAYVPEPSPFVLLAIGFTCLILVRKIRYIAPFHS